MDVVALARALADAITKAAAHNAQPNIEKKAKPEGQEQPRVHEAGAGRRWDLRDVIQRLAAA